MKVNEKFNVNNKTVIITGGMGLLGKKHAEVVAEYGGIPIILDINDGEGFIFANEIESKYNTECLFLECDITKESSVFNVRNEVLKSFGKIDILINNAAIDAKAENIDGEATSRLENFSLKQWNTELAVGLTGSMLCSKIFGKEMAKERNGVILNISSDLGIISPDQRLYRQDGIDEDQQPVKPITYSVIKHGLMGLTKYLATYWADKGIRVNSISPGGIYTNQNPEFVQRLSNLVPLGRMANEDEYKASIIFLISDASSYMTGSNLVIDGGRTCW